MFLKVLSLVPFSIQLSLSSFADDIAMNSFDDLSALQLDVSLIQEWMDERLNLTNMHGYLQEAKSTLLVDGQIIGQVSMSKYLGVTI